MDLGMLAGKKIGYTGTCPDSLGPNQLWADGQVVDLTNLVKAQIQFQALKAKAIAAGTYDGKSLDWLGGGRSHMLYDQLRVEGYDHSMAKKIVADQFHRQIDQVMATGTPLQKAKVQAYYDSHRRH